MSKSNSATISKMKDMWFEVQQAFPFNHSTSKMFGYIGGFSSTLIKNIPAIALSVVSVAAKNPTVSKVAGCFLGAYGAATLGSNVLTSEAEKEYFV